MNDHAVDTITAIATAVGQSGVAIIRVSGPQVRFVAKAIVGTVPEPRVAEFRNFRSSDQSTIDHGLVLFFPGPNSFTGEDVLEFQGHGGMVVQNMLLKQVLALDNVRHARPGEFSERAFLNNKIDLAQAEAIADLIASSSEQAASSAMRSLQGDFSRTIHQLVEGLIALRMYVEAAIDFPDEEIDFLSDGKIASQLENLELQLNTVIANAKQGALLREGMRVVIAGKPNAGKSSLLNALSGEDLAIVTDIPGTTRDVLREQINIDGLPLHIIDTAGLRDTDDIVEQEGVKRAWNEIEHADCVLLIEDVTENNVALEELYQRCDHKKVLVVKNKIDLTKSAAKVESSEYTQVFISAKENIGLDLLKAKLKELVGYKEYNEEVCIARGRHIDALHRAQQHFEQAKIQLYDFKAGELVAEEVRQAQNVLGEITGQFSTEDLLGKIFSSFCIGK